MRKVRIILLVFAFILIVFVLFRWHFFDGLTIRYNKHVVNTLEEDVKNRIWAHRVNSTEKAREAAAVFKGMEIDVVFDSALSVFDVNHPPASSIQLDLKNLLLSIKESQVSYWIDWKNPTVSNAEKALLRLSEVVDSLEIDRNKIIVECQRPAMLKEFTRAGFNTSYYLPQNYLEKFAESEGKTLGQADKIILEKLKSTLKQGEFDYISCHSRFLSFVQKIIPESKKILLWNQQSEIGNYFDRRKIIKTLQQDSRIDVLLVSLDSRYDR